MKILQSLLLLYISFIVIYCQAPNTVISKEALQKVVSLSQIFSGCSDSCETEFDSFSFNGICDSSLVQILNQEDYNLDFHHLGLYKTCMDLATNNTENPKIKHTFLSQKFYLEKFFDEFEPSENNFISNDEIGICEQKHAIQIACGTKCRMAYLQIPKFFSEEQCRNFLVFRDLEKFFGTESEKYSKTTITYLLKCEQNLDSQLSNYPQSRKYTQGLQSCISNKLNNLPMFTPNEPENDNIIVPQCPNCFVENPECGSTCLDDATNNFFQFKYCPTWDSNQPKTIEETQKYKDCLEASIPEFSEEKSLKFHQCKINCLGDLILEKQNEIQPPTPAPTPVENPENPNTPNEPENPTPENPNNPSDPQNPPVTLPGTVLQGQLNTFGIIAIFILFVIL